MNRIIAAYVIRRGQTWEWLPLVELAGNEYAPALPAGEFSCWMPIPLGFQADVSSLHASAEAFFGPASHALINPSSRAESAQAVRSLCQQINDWCAKQNRNNEVTISD